MILKATKPVPGRCGHKAPQRGFLLRLELLVSCSLNKGCVCSFSGKGVQETSSNLAIPVWDLTKTWDSKQALHICDRGQPFP